jgi:hypothetical protein
MAKHCKFDIHEVARVVIQDARPLLDKTVLSVDFSAGPIKSILKSTYGMSEVEASEVAEFMRDRAEKSVSFEDSIDNIHYTFKSKSSAKSSNYERLRGWKLNTANALIKTYGKDKFTTAEGKFIKPSSALTFAHGGGEDRKDGSAYSASSARGFRVLRKLQEAGAGASFEFVSNLMLESNTPFIGAIHLEYLESLTTPSGGISRTHKVYLGFESPQKQQININEWEASETKRIEEGILEHLREYAIECGGGEASKELDRVIDTSKAKRKAARHKRATTRKNPKASILNKKRPKKLKSRVATSALPRFRDLKGKFTSAASIKQLIQAQITAQVKDNMGEGGSLVNRTGRFAESVTITNVTQTRQGSLTAFYSYMKYPYQTFERGFKQGSTRRDPRLLIHKSIKEIALKLVHSKLNIKTRRV